MTFEPTQSQHYREQAEKLRRMAADSSTGEIREQLLILADDYDQLSVRDSKDRR